MDNVTTRRSYLEIVHFYLIRFQGDSADFVFFILSLFTCKFVMLYPRALVYVMNPEGDLIAILFTLMML